MCRVTIPEQEQYLYPDLDLIWNSELRVSFFVGRGYWLVASMIACIAKQANPTGSQCDPDCLPVLEISEYKALDC